MGMKISRAGFWHGHLHWLLMGRSPCGCDMMFSPEDARPEAVGGARLTRAPCDPCNGGARINPFAAANWIWALGPVSQGIIRPLCIVRMSSASDLVSFVSRRIGTDATPAAASRRTPFRSDKGFRQSQMPVAKLVKASAAALDKFCVPDKNNLRIMWPGATPRFRRWPGAIAQPTGRAGRDSERGRRLCRRVPAPPRRRPRQPRRQPAPRP